MEEEASPLHDYFIESHVVGLSQPDDSSEKYDILFVVSFEENDVDMEETGEEYQEDLALNFEFIPIWWCNVYSDE